MRAPTDLEVSEMRLRLQMLLSSLDRLKVLVDRMIEEGGGQLELHLESWPKTRPLSTLSERKP